MKLRFTQWSNYQKISKGAHTIVNANEAMLLITGGSRTSESGGQIFSEIFERLFRGVSENLFAFFPKKCSSILPKFLTTFFFSHRLFPSFNMYFSVEGAKSVADINRGTKTLTFPQIHSRCHYSFCQLRRGPWPDWPPLDPHK